MAGWTIKPNHTFAVLHRAKKSNPLMNNSFQTLDLCILYLYKGYQDGE